MNDIKNKILKKIETQSIHKKPRWQFVIHTLLGLLLGIGMLVITIFIVILLMSVINDYTIAHGFGIVRSPFVFAQNILFWLLVIIGVGITVGLYKRLRNHTYLYRYKKLYSGIIIIALILGFVIGIQIVDRSMQFGRIGEKRIPVVHQLDQAVRPPQPQGLLSGKVTAIQDDMMVVQTKNRRIFYVHIPPYEQVTGNFSIGDHVVVFGIITNDQVEAQKIVKQ